MTLTGLCTYANNAQWARISVEGSFEFLSVFDFTLDCLEIRIYKLDLFTKINNDENPHPNDNNATFQQKILLQCGFM